MRKKIQFSEMKKYKLQEYGNTNSRNTEIQITDIKIQEIH